MQAAVASDIAYRSIRTRGTIGGSLVHADPAADWPLALATLDVSSRLRALPTGALPPGTFMRAAFTVAADAPPRRHLGDWLREDLRLTGLHRGCEHGVCRACTVEIDGAAGARLHRLPGRLHGRPHPSAFTDPASRHAG